MAHTVKNLELPTAGRPVRRQVVARATRSQPAFSNEIFADEAAYNLSVETVVALIKSGQAPAREPDEA